MTTQHRPARVRTANVEALMQTVSEQDRTIIQSIHQLRLITGKQLERLHFSHLSIRSRSVMRWRVLKRLVDSRVLLPIRRYGSTARRSAELCYTLDSAGQRLMQIRANLSGDGKTRRPYEPGERFIEHTLAVAELYVALTERARTGRYELESYVAEPTCWWPDGLGGWIKPDAFLVLRGNQGQDFWWYEADLATESLPTIRTKLLTYLSFVERGQLGPDGMVPRVLFAVPTEARRDAIRSEVAKLPEPASYMFAVATLFDAHDFLIHELISW